jgi:hypothetical protein
LKGLPQLASHLTDLRLKKGIAGHLFPHFFAKGLDCLIFSKFRLAKIRIAEVYPLEKKFDFVRKNLKFTD